jgi:hypothetical protein
MYMTRRSRYVTIALAVVRCHSPKPAYRPVFRREIASRTACPASLAPPILAQARQPPVVA